MSLLGGCSIKGEDESWDFGTGAGFYVDATEDPWKTNYRMYSYVTEEVISLYLLIDDCQQFGPSSPENFKPGYGTGESIWYRFIDYVSEHSKVSLYGNLIYYGLN